MIFLQVTIINFTVTRLGLEDQILSDVVRLERPDLEEQRNQLILRLLILKILKSIYLRKTFFKYLCTSAL